MHSGRAKWRDRDKKRAGITGAFGVPEENYNGRRVVEFCKESGLCVGNTYLKHRSVHEYARVAKGRNDVEIKSMTDLVLVKRDML